MAEYVADFIRTAKQDYGLDIAYTGVWNERVYDAAYVKELYRRMKKEHLTTKIVCCDEYPGEGEGQWAIADEILKDPELATDIDVIGVHYPLVKGKTHDHRCGSANRQTAVVQRRSAQRRRRTFCEPRLAFRRAHSRSSL